MKVKKKYIIVPLVLILLLVGLGYGTLQLMDSRTFQFFGGLVDHVDTNQKVVALTLDDAPGPQTGDILRVLGEKDVKATFFAIGSALERYPDEARAIASAGMEIGNHSYSHERMVFKAMSFYQDEIERTSALIRKTGYAGEITFRPPYGKKLVGLPWYLNQQHMRTIMWDVEPDTYRDASAGKDDAKFIVSYTLAHTRPGSIILLHPFCQSGCAADREAIPGIIDGLRAEGYSFVTISRLLSYGAA